MIPSPPPRYPNIVVSVTEVGTDRETLMEVVSEAMRATGVPEGRVNQFRQQMIHVFPQLVVVAVSMWVSIE